MPSKRKWLTIFFCCFSALLILCAGRIQASTSDGTIDAANRYAWSENAGWLDFGTANGNVHVLDSSLTGYVWSENLGWISLNCSNDSSCGTVNFGVANDGSGVLSGYAWGENTGWIDFKPAGSGVTISAAGVFSGYAWSENIGWINFGVANPVTTDWRSSGTAAPVAPQNPAPAISSSGSFLPSLVLSPGSNPPGSVLPPQPNNLQAQPGSNTMRPSNSAGSENTASVSDLPGSVSKPTIVESSDSQFADRSGANGTEQSLANSFANSLLSKIITALGIVAGIYVLARYLFSVPISIFEVRFIPTRLWSLFSVAFGLRKRFVPWGTVYDSVTKQPLDPAVVTLKDSAGKVVTEVMTDMDGRYGFLLPAGEYFISVGKTHYKFPSQKMRGKTRDRIYSELYFGEKFVVNEKGPVVTRDIPMDAVGFDWNEAEKRRRHEMHFFYKRNFLLLRICDALSFVGFLVSVLALATLPSTYNLVVFALYIVIYLSRLLGRNPRAFGSITERTGNIPLAYAILHVATPDKFTTITNKVADQFGRYYCLVSPGSYLVSIEKKTGEEMYETVAEYPELPVRDGIIRRHFKI
jgi:hypothetical protein